MAVTAHIKIDKHPDDPARWRVLLNGTDVADQLATDGLQVEFRRDGAWGAIPTVTMTFVEVDLDADLPEAALEALREREV